MKIMRKATIERFSFPVDDYEYYVRVWFSVDGGQTYAYCGIGRFCRTEQEAQEYAASILTVND